MVKYSSRFKCVAGGLEMGLGGGRLVGHAGSGVLGGFCDAVGSGRALSQALPYRGPGGAVFDRGAVFAQMALVAAGGGEACSDIEALRAEPEVFGSVPSASTVHRRSPAWTPSGSRLSLLRWPVCARWCGP